MRIFLAIDDTDNLESRGTGELADNQSTLLVFSQVDESSGKVFRQTCSKQQLRTF